MLFPATPEHLITMMPWFKTEAELKQWAGPRFRYPFDHRSFIEDTKLDRLNSQALMQGDALVGFGQFYERAGRCHLGRLVINPDCRGQGHIHTLVELMIQKAQSALSLPDVSLFVLPDNTTAIRAYQKQGFRFADYPGNDPVEGMVYMVKTAA
ncbi:hypothetical protein HMF8227_01971 [Saliniradius amylolyticus]|uniref:N-acetyltransferase domain-containing protein n=2 Tax=Saliniradius amylolyticus TaxID=2183582 RepID=A0A2S2E465_9ALTE|nr:hypothetical protein HMF8227_01971 [Saliniradius amylolyticus]